MAITKKDVQYVADLCRIQLDDKELNRLAGELEGILKFIDQLKKVEIKDVSATSHVLAVQNVFRKDEVRPSLACEQALQNAPQKTKDFFKVPPVIE